MDERRLLARIQFLSHKLFIDNPEGIEFIKLMKVLHVQTPTFPMKKSIMDQHGGPVGWAGYREGQLQLLRSLEQLGQNYLQKLEAENKEKA
jgi:hypothetical protein